MPNDTNTDNDDICGAETTDGGKCQRPMGWGTDSSIGPCTDHREQHHGRPSKFTDERARDACDAARFGTSKAGCARAAAIGEATLQRWLEKNPTFTNADGERVDFRSAFTRARHEGERQTIEEARYPDEHDADAQTNRFLLATSYGYEKTERRDVRVDDDADLSKQPDVLVIGGDDEEDSSEDEGDGE